MFTFMFLIFLISKSVTFLIFYKTGFCPMTKLKLMLFPNYSITEIQEKFPTDLIFSPCFISLFVFVEVFFLVLVSKMYLLVSISYC